MPTTVVRTYLVDDIFHAVLSTGADVTLRPVSGWSSSTPIQTGNRKRTRKLQAQATPGRSPLGVLTYPSDLEIELCLEAFGYTFFPFATRWIDDNGNADTFLLMDQVDVVQSSDMGEPGFWDITIVFSCWNMDSDSVNPILQQPEISWSFEQNEIPALFDVAGRPIVNSAADPFLPGLSLKYATPILLYARNEANFDPLVASTYIDHVNGDQFLGMAPNTAKVRDIRASRMKSIYNFFYRVEYEIGFNFQNDAAGNIVGHQAYVLDAGLNYRDINNVRLPILLGDGSPTTEPLPLDGDGDTLPVGGTPVYKTFQTYPQVSFAGLNIRI